MCGASEATRRHSRNPGSWAGGREQQEFLFPVKVGRKGSISLTCWQEMINISFFHFSLLPLYFIFPFPFCLWYFPFPVSLSHFIFPFSFYVLSGGKITRFPTFLVVWSIIESFIYFLAFFCFSFVAILDYWSYFPLQKPTKTLVFPSHILLTLTKLHISFPISSHTDKATFSLPISFPNLKNLWSLRWSLPYWKQPHCKSLYFRE